MFQKKYEDDVRRKKKGGHSITHVSSLFSKYIKILKAPQSTVMQASVDVINERYGTRLTPTQCRYDVRSKTLSLSVSGMIKTEVLLSKAAIITEISNRIGKESAPKDIL